MRSVRVNAWSSDIISPWYNQVMVGSQPLATLESMSTLLPPMFKVNGFYDFCMRVGVGGPKSYIILNLFGNSYFILKF